MYSVITQGSVGEELHVHVTVSVCCTCLVSLQKLTCSS